MLHYSLMYANYQINKILLTDFVMIDVIQHIVMLHYDIIITLFLNILICANFMIYLIHYHRLFFAI